MYFLPTLASWTACHQKPAVEASTPTQPVQGSVLDLKRVDALQTDLRLGIEADNIRVFRDFSVDTPALLVSSSELTREQWQQLDGDALRPTGTRNEANSDCATCSMDSISWCQAVLLANLLSTREDLEPAYLLPDGFHAGMSPTACDELSPEVQRAADATGYRMLTRAELVAISETQDNDPADWARHYGEQHVDQCPPGGAEICGLHRNVPEWVDDRAWKKGSARGGSLEPVPTGEDGWTGMPARAYVGEVGPLPLRQNLSFCLPSSGAGVRLVRPATPDNEASN